MVAVKIEVPFWMVLFLATHDYPIGFDFSVFSNGRFAVAATSFRYGRTSRRTRVCSRANPFRPWNVSRNTIGVLGNELTPKVLVPGGGVEPPRAEARRILSPLRLPVPPSRLYLQVPYFTTSLWLFFVSSKNDECATV
jgi:hypothetical protein